MVRGGERSVRSAVRGVITSYSIHYTKLYEALRAFEEAAEREAGTVVDNKENGDG